MNIVKCENLVVKYDNTVALNDVSLSVDEGDYLCVVGANGAGKSTLMNTLLGLVKPNSGKILWNNERKAQAGYLPQTTTLQKDFPASVYEVVLSGFQNQLGFMPFYTKKHKQAVEEVLKNLGIYNLKKRSYTELSGGQRQRVLLARALCASSDFLLLDEPVSGLDPLITAELYDIVESMNKKHNTAVMMISHDIQSAVKYANKILHLDGDKSFYGLKDEYLQSGLYKEIVYGQKAEINIGGHSIVS